MKHFLLKINWFASFKNFRISLYFLYRDFQRHFSIDFAILLKLPFYIKTQYKCFYWKSSAFCQHHFSTENQYKIFYWISCTFSTCDFVLKTNIIFSIENQLIFLSIFFLLKINWFLPASFFYWKSTRIFLLKSNWFLMILYFWHFLDVIHTNRALLLTTFSNFKADNKCVFKSFFTYISVIFPPFKYYIF